MLHLHSKRSGHVSQRAIQASKHGIVLFSHSQTTYNENKNVEREQERTTLARSSRKAATACSFESEGLLLSARSSSSVPAEGDDNGEALTGGVVGDLVGPVDVRHHRHRYFRHPHCYYHQYYH